MPCYGRGVFNQGETDRGDLVFAGPYFSFNNTARNQGGYFRSFNNQLNM
jgi:hypothetical protein